MFIQNTISCFSFWAVRYPHLLILFIRKKFIALLATAPISEFIAWFVTSTLFYEFLYFHHYMYLIASFTLDGDDDETNVAMFRNEFELRYV